MREVGFQSIKTYGDFKETYLADDPDFFIHVAEKSYRRDEELTELYSTAVHTARNYYNSEDADNFYATVWGGEDIHIGIYNSDDEPIGRATAASLRGDPGTARGTWTDDGVGVRARLHHGLVWLQLGGDARAVGVA